MGYAQGLKGLPDVKVHETADEEKFDCPPGWFLVVNAIGMSFMTALTVVGAFFFCLAAPETITNHCWLWRTKSQGLLLQAACTASTVAFWTYPVICCIFVGLIFAKNLVDARMYYEFLLHKVFVGYERRSIMKIFNYPALPLLLLYAAVAMTSIGWHANSLAIEHHPNQVQEYMFGYMTYLTPVLSFVATLISKWSVQYFLIPLCEFLEDFRWARGHIDGSTCYPFDTIHKGYLGLENALMNLPEDQQDQPLDTAQMVALVDHYCQEYEQNLKQSMMSSDDSSASSLVEKAKQKMESLVVDSMRHPWKKFVYWPIRLFFNKHLKDDRSKEFRMLSVAYILGVVLSTIYGCYVLACCVVTALQVEYVLVDSNSMGRMLIRTFSLLNGRELAEEHALEDDVAKAFRYVNPANLRAQYIGHLAPGM